MANLTQLPVSPTCTRGTDSSMTVPMDGCGADTTTNSSAG